MTVWRIRIWDTTKFLDLALFSSTQLLPGHRQIWRRAVKTKAALNETDRIAAAKVKGAARKSQAPLTYNVTSKHFQHLQATNEYFTLGSASLDITGPNVTSTRHLPVLPSQKPLSSGLPQPSSRRPPPTSSTSTATTTALYIPTTGKNTLGAVLALVFTKTTPIISNMNSIPTCPRLDRILTSRISLITHL
ncbi:hypothetical protein SprV_0200903300 [Sparganum proliferum]